MRKVITERLQMFGGAASFTRYAVRASKHEYKLYGSAAAYHRQGMAYFVNMDDAQGMVDQINAIAA